MRAKNSAGWGLWSPSGTDTTDAPVGAPAAPVGTPAAPAAPTVTGGAQQVTATWTAPAQGRSALTAYQVRHRVGSGDWTTSSDLAASSTSKRITGLAASTTYQVQVRAKNSAGYGPWSASGTGTTTGATRASTPPGAPGTPTVTGGARRVTAVWTAPSTGGSAITDYQLRWRLRTGPGAWQLGGDLVPSALSQIIAHLAVSTTYQVQVRAKNSAGYGRWSASGTGTTTAQTSSSRPILLQGNLTSGTGSNFTGWAGAIGSFVKTSGTLPQSAFGFLLHTTYASEVVRLRFSSVVSATDYLDLRIGSTRYRFSDAQVDRRGTPGTTTFQWYVYPRGRRGGLPAVGSSVQVTLR